MAQLLVRDLDDQVMARLKERARRNQRSLQAEARAILETAAPRYTKEEALEVSWAWQEKLRGSRHVRQHRSDPGGSGQVTGTVVDASSVVKVVPAGAAGRRGAAGGRRRSGLPGPRAARR
jgi:hypothetical protein